MNVGEHGGYLSLVRLLKMMLIFDGSMLTTWRPDFVSLFIILFIMSLEIDNLENFRPTFKHILLYFFNFAFNSLLTY